MSMPSAGSPYPPQLHLSIPPSTTSFKRSFEQFGFDLDDSPVPGNNGGSNPLHQASSSNNGASGSGNRPGPSVGALASTSGRDNNRNKRARSASTETTSSSGRSSRSNYQSVSSGSSSMHRLSARPSLEVPPRLPTPDVDVDMSDVNDVAQHSPTSAPSATPPAVPGAPINFPEAYRLAFQAMHGETSPASPPVLPPLRLGVDHEEEPFMASQEQGLALNGDEPPRIHIDLPQAPLTINEDEGEGTEAAIILPDPPTLPPIPTGDLFEPAPQSLADHVPPSPSLHELRQWMDEAASPPAETLSGVADPGTVTSRVVLAAPSNSSTSPTNPDGERSSPTRNRLQRSLGDFLSVAVESDGDSPISTLFPERREEASRRQHDETEARIRTNESPSAVTSSYRPPALSSFFTRRHNTFRGGDGDGTNFNGESLPSTAPRDATRSGPNRTHNTASANAESSRGSTSPSTSRWSSIVRRSTQPTWFTQPPSLDFDSSSDDEPETNESSQSYSGPFAFSSSTRRALREQRLAGSSSGIGATTEQTSTSASQPFSTRPPRQVSFRPSSSSLVGESISDMRARELDRLGLGLPTSTSSPITTQRSPDSYQGAGSRSYAFAGAGAPIFDTGLPRIQSSTTAQSSILDDIAARMDFDRSTTQAPGRGSATTAPSSQTSMPPAVSTFYPTTLHERRYHTLNPEFELRSSMTSRTPGQPYFASFFDDDMTMAHDSESSGDASPIFEPASSRNQPPATGASRATFIPPAIPSPNLDLSFNADGSSAQSTGGRTTDHRSTTSGPGLGQDLATPASNPVDYWPSFPDFPFALDVFTNELSHIPPSPRIETPNPPLAPRYASGSLAGPPTSHPEPSATTTSVFGSGTLSTGRLGPGTTVSPWDSVAREDSLRDGRHPSQEAEPRNLRFLSLMRERDERERRRRAQETPSYRGENLGLPGPTFYSGTSAYPSGNHIGATSTALPPSSGPTPAPRATPYSTANSSSTTDTPEGAIASRFIPGPFSNTMRALERERNAADAARSFRQQYNRSETNTAPVRPRNPLGSPERTNTSTSTPPVHSHTPVSIPTPGAGGSSSSSTGNVNPAMTFHRHLVRRSSFTGPSEQRTTYTSIQREAEETSPAVRRLREMQAMHDRLSQGQNPSQTTSTRTGPPPSELRRRSQYYAQYLDTLPQTSALSSTPTGTRRDSLIPPGSGPPYRPPTAARTTDDSATVTASSTQLQAYTEDNNTRPFAQAIESLREPRQGSTHITTSADMMRRRARLEQLAEETRAMNRDRARVIRSEYVNRRRHTLNLRGFSLGDFMRDEEFDESYEALLSLSSIVGEARPRGTPGTVLETMEKGKYEDWATTESDKRCPICLDDYTSSDQVMRLKNCSHWLHTGCLEQWLKGASTCPVCRNQVHGAPSGSASASSTTARRNYLPPMRYARESRFGLDRPTREPATNLASASNNNASNTSNSARHSTINSSGRDVSGNSPASSRTGPSGMPPTPRLPPSYYAHRRRFDDDDDPPLGPSGSGGTSSSSSSSSSFGSMYPF